MWTTHRNAVAGFQTDTDASGDVSTASASSYKKSSIGSHVQLAINVEPSLDHWRKLVALWLGHHQCVEWLLTGLSYGLLVMLLIQCVVAIAGCLSLGSVLPPATAYLWLVSVLVALIVYVFIFEPLKVLIIALHFALSQNKMLLI